MEKQVLAPKTSHGPNVTVLVASNRTFASWHRFTFLFRGFSIYPGLLGSDSSDPSLGNGRCSASNELQEKPLVVQDQSLTP